jgi:dihydrodipicolinate synthase/N-acetylneuraminate lyase
MYAPVADAARALSGKLVAAAATPMTAEGATDSGVTRAYLDGLVRTGADGLAVGVHTGRGSLLDMATRTELVEIAASVSPLVIAGVSTDPGGAVAWPSRAADAGATALLVFPPADGQVASALGHLDALWEATGLPLVAFDLYTQPYTLDDLCRVLEHPAVAAFKPARLYDAVACQDGIAAALERGRCVLTGEDRMLGPSLMWGAHGALVGIAAASAMVTAAALRMHEERNAEGFLRASAAVDALASVTFREPWDGYVQRMLWIAADEGLVPVEYAVDPARAPGLGDAERDEVVIVARQARALAAEFGTPSR